MNKHIVITNTAHTRFSAGDQGHGMYGIYAETKCGVPVPMPVSMLLWHERAALHAAMIAAATSSSDRPTVVICGCNEDGCDARVTFQGAQAIVSRHDAVLHVAISPDLYAACIAATSAGYEDQRALDEAAHAAEIEAEIAAESDW